MNYKAYLKTPHWIKKRQEALEYYGNKCMLCSGNLFLEVHHNNYEHLGCETMQDLVVLCCNCHSKHHGKKSKKKYKPKERWELPKAPQPFKFR